MLTSAQLKKIVTETRPLIEQQLDLTEQIAGLREVVTSAGGDWSQLKALVKAQIQDERDEVGDGKRVRKILDKADYAQGYADMLGLAPKMNEKNSFADGDSDPAFDEWLEEVADRVDPDLLIQIIEGSKTAAGRQIIMAAIKVVKEDRAAEPPHEPVTGEFIEHDSTAVDLGGEGGKNAPVLPPDTHEERREDAATASAVSAPEASSDDRSDETAATDSDAAVEKKPSRQAHNLEIAGASPAPATISEPDHGQAGETPAPASEPAATGTAHHPIPVAVAGVIRHELTPPVSGMHRHEYLACFPENWGRAFVALKEDILANGIREPIQRQGDTIIDGWSRYVIARELMMRYPVQEYAGDDPLRDIIELNMRSRSLNLVERQAIAKKLIKLVPDRADEIADMLDLNQMREAAE